MSGTPTQEQQARAAGFPSYAAMIAFHRQRSNSLRRPENYLADRGGMNAAMSLHPSVLFQWIADRFGEAVK